ncbi:hypothetical protein BVY01_03580, partial [bacterium I07]
FTFTIKKISCQKVMVVDDERSNVELIKRCLDSEELEFLEAYDGNEAVIKAQAELPSLILLDMMLPELDGYGVIERLRLNTETRQIPVLIMSGYNVDEDRLCQKERDCGVPVLIKPFKPSDLRHQVKLMLNN